MSAYCSWPPRADDASQRRCPPILQQHTQSILHDLVLSIQKLAHTSCILHLLFLWFKLTDMIIVVELSIPAALCCSSPPSVLAAVSIRTTPRARTVYTMSLTNCASWLADWCRAGRTAITTLPFALSRPCLLNRVTERLARTTRAGRTAITILPFALSRPCLLNRVTKRLARATCMSMNCGHAPHSQVVVSMQPQHLGLASSTQYHQEDGPASSAGHLSMSTEQCEVVFLLVTWSCH